MSVSFSISITITVISTLPRSRIQKHLLSFAPLVIFAGEPNVLSDVVAREITNPSIKALAKAPLRCSSSFFSVIDPRRSFW